MQRVKEILSNYRQEEEVSVLEFCSAHLLSSCENKVELKFLIGKFREHRKDYISSQVFARILRTAGYKLKPSNGNRTYVYNVKYMEEI